MLFQKATRSAGALFGFLFCLAVLAASAAQARTQAALKLPNVAILATGGTIAGTGATSTTTVGYTAATVGIQTLIAAVPEMTKIARHAGRDGIFFEPGRQEP